MSSDGLFSLDIQGLDKLQASLNLDRINKQIAINVGLASKTLINTIRTEVTQRYNIPVSKFNSSLKGQSISGQVQGRGIILNSIVFEDTPVNLAKFVTLVKPGNIVSPPMPKKREGRVHYVTVRKGNETISYGRFGFGGFLIKGGTALVERKGMGRNAELAGIYAPTVVDMVNMVTNYNDKVIHAMLNFSDTLLNNIVDK